MTEPGPHEWSGRVIVAGGTGFIGLSLARHLADLGAEVVILSRHPPSLAGPWRHVPWDARTLGPWVEELRGVQGVVNLVGRSVDCRKTPETLDEILRSRVEATLVLGQAIARVGPPPAWVQMSTAHLYGDPPAIVCDEDSPYGLTLSYAPAVGLAWEAAFHASLPATTRGVVLRTGFVLGRNGGALKRLAGLARWGLGGTVGSGTQGMSWIHELDMNRLIERGLRDPDMRGAYVASAPHPVDNRELMRELRRAVKMPIGLPSPAWLVRIGAVFLNTDPDLALYGRFVVSRRLREEGFEFRFPELRAALQDLL
jgi:uncharacterized protein (TIGR01777 family)